jgi:hypothetical protein
MELIIVPLIFGLIVAVALAAAAGSRRYETQWKTAADRLQLGFTPGRLFSRPKIAGRLGSLSVSIDVSSSSSGSSSSVQTRYRVKYPSLGFELRMSRQTGLAKAAAMLGMSDTKVGDTEFDEAFSVKTSAPERLAALLSPAGRRVLVNLVEDYRSVKITDELVSYQKNGIDRETGTVVTTAQRLIEAARTLQGASAEPTQPSPSKPIPVREVIPPPPPVLRPDPFDIRPVLDPTPPPSSTPAKLEPMPTKAATPVPIAAGVTPEEIAEALFAKKGLSFQVARLYEDRYDGQTVEWPGVVRGVSTGIGPSDPTRVTALVATVRNELFGSVDVEAIASISGRAPRDLAVGREVKLSGTLSGIDAMGRRLYLDNARLV